MFPSKHEKSLEEKSAKKEGCRIFKEKAGHTGRKWRKHSEKG